MGLVSLAAPDAGAQELDVSYTVEMASNLSYVFRGDRVSAQSIEPVMQPFGEVSVKASEALVLGGGVWISRAIGAEEPAQEIDPYLIAILTLPSVELKGSYTLTMTDTDPVDSMHELTLQVSLLAGLPVTPFVAVAADPIRTMGAYAWAGAAHEVELGPVTLGTTLSAGISQYEGIDLGVQDVTLQSRADVALADTGLYLAFSGALAYSGRSAELHPTAGVGVGFSR